MSPWISRPKDRLGGDPPFADERDPIAVFRIDGVIEGWIPRLEGRVSDGLNDADRMSVRTGPPDGTPEDWLELDLDDVVAVAAPPRPPSPLRAARRRYAVEIRAGPYRVKGIAHLPLGSDPERYVTSASRRWLPLTACTVAAGDDEWAVEVVIVNLDHASRDIGVDTTPPFL
jgi:hypothetical protein